MRLLSHKHGQGKCVERDPRFPGLVTLPLTEHLGAAHSLSAGEAFIDICRVSVLLGSESYSVVKIFNMRTVRSVPL